MAWSDEQVSAASPATGTRPSPLTWLPVFAFLAASVACWIFPTEGVYNPPNLVMVLNWIFVSANGLIVAVLAARTFLANGQSAVLLLGCRMLSFGLASAVSPVLNARELFDAGIATHNIMMCVTGGCSLLAALLLHFRLGHQTIASRPTVLLVAYGIVAGLLAILATSAVNDLLPTHFVPGVGPTPLRQWVLSSAITMIAAASLFLIVTSRRTQSQFLYWYGLGLALLATGLLGILIITHVGTLSVWIGRISQYAGGMYLLVAAVIAFKQTPRWTMPLDLLKETQERYASLVELCPDAIIVHADNKIVFANPAAVKIFGAGAVSDLIGRDMLSAVHPDFHSFITDRQAKFQSGSRLKIPVEIKMLRLDGQNFDAEAAGALVQYEGRTAFQVVLRDVSERKRTQEALMLAKTQADAANRAKDHFLAVLGHELRNPLAPVRNSVAIMKRVGKIDPIIERARDIIDRQVTHMARLIDDLLDVSRIALGKITLQKKEFDLGSVVRSVVDDHRPFLENDGQRLEFTAPTQALPVYGDAARIAQIVNNLIVNANKFTDRGGQVNVELAAAGDNDAVITVRDTGIGMDEATLQRLFEPFAQADRSIDRSRGGLGLGLALVRGLVELHGGSFKASSPGLGKGSEFIVRLPIRLMPKVVAAETRDANAKPRRSLPILIIEDNRDAAETLRTLLELSGHEVAVAHTGREGLDMARQHKPQIILCDIGLPGMNGYEVAQSIRKTADLQSVYLVAMTGYGQDEDRRQALEAGFDHHLTKPADPEALEQLLAR